LTTVRNKEPLKFILPRTSTVSLTPIEVENLAENEPRKIRIPPTLYRKITKMHNQQNKAQSADEFLIEVLRKGLEVIEKVE